VATSYRMHQITAKQRGLSHELTEGAYLRLTGSECVYCGCDPANGVDRWNQSLGYTAANCLPCCKPCNSRKSAYEGRAGWLGLFLQSIWAAKYTRCRACTRRTVPGSVCSYTHQKHVPRLKSAL
jgi:hypothetical protein